MAIQLTSVEAALCRIDLVGLATQTEPIADEVQFGVYRPGTTMWGFAFHGTVPDIVTMGEPIADGQPLGVVVTRIDILERFLEATGFYSTFGGNPVSAAAGLATLEVLEVERLQDNALAAGGHFKNGLRA